MNLKKFSKEWFENKLKQYKNMQDGTFKYLTNTKGFKPISSDDKKYSKKEQRIKSLINLAKEKNIELEEFSL